MIYKHLDYCPVVRTAADILYPYISSISDPWYDIYGGYHTGVDIMSSGSIHSICQGVVIYIGIEEITKSYVINIQYNAEFVIQYWGIITKYIDLGDTVESSQMIGECKEFVHVAYLSTTQAESHWPVRVGSVTYYTHNPESYITGELKLPDCAIRKIITSNIDVGSVQWTSEMSAEFTNNRGDEVPNSV